VEETDGGAGLEEEGPTVAKGAVEGAGAAAAAGDEDGEFRGGRFGGKGEELIANGDTGDFSAGGGEEGEGVGQAEQDAGGEASREAVDQAWGGVGLEDKHGEAAEEGGGNDRGGDVAAEGEDGGGAPAMEEAEAAGDARGQEGGGAEFTGERDALEGAGGDPFDGEAGGGDEPGFQPVGRADKEDGMVAADKVASDGKQWHDVTGSASSSHDEDHYSEPHGAR
jgi:hypothetical protein